MYIIELQFRGIALYCHRLTIGDLQKDTSDIYLANNYPKKVRIGIAYFHTKIITRIMEEDGSVIYICSDRNATKILKHSSATSELIYLRIIRICV